MAAQKELKRRGKKASKAQKDYMMDYLTNHPEMAEQKFTSTFTYAVYQTMWEELTERLNMRGPPKTSEKWKVYFKDQKTKIKTLEADRKREVRHTGGGTAPKNPISPTKEKILQLLGGELAISGECVEEYGINGTSTSAGDTMTDEEDDPSSIFEIDCVEEVLVGPSDLLEDTKSPATVSKNSKPSTAPRVAAAGEKKIQKRSRKRKVQEEDKEMSELMKMQKDQTAAITTMAESIRIFAEAFAKNK